MANLWTLTQGGAEASAAQQASILPHQPPAATPGFEPRARIGGGAYGEVWLGIDLSTGRKVAIKFYSNRRCVDWADLELEVKKLVLLAENRSIVQILDFGRDSEPPYYVMEYLENGSLEDWVQKSGCPSAAMVVQIFRQTAQALVHAHAKGVFHCDLKPANVLLDQDRRPCLADFGQSRLSTEHSPALGTLFFMAPEQADLRAVPDQAWDIYALGAIAYFLLVGKPPLADEKLQSELAAASGLVDRLACYQRAILSAPRATAHHRVSGVDRSLAAIIDRCLERDPKRRYQTAKEVLDSLVAREQSERRKSALLLAVAAPLLLLVITAAIRWSFNVRAIDGVEKAYMKLALQNNAFAADVAANNTGTQISRLINAARDEALHPAFLSLFQRNIGALETAPASPVRQNSTEDVQQQLEDHLQDRVEHLKRTSAPEFGTPHITSLSAFAQSGVAIARRSDTSHRFLYPPITRIGKPRLLPEIYDDESDRWLKTISVPILDPENQEEVGALGMTLNVSELGSFGVAAAPPAKDLAAQLSFVVLVDANGKILHHPAFDQPNGEALRKAAYDKQILLSPDLLQEGNLIEDYKDPFAEHNRAKSDNNRWVAAVQKVPVSDDIAQVDVDLFVIVQSDYHAIHKPAEDLWQTFVINMIIVTVVALVSVGGLMFILIRFERRPQV